jgi:hypothetical protein
MPIVWLIVIIVVIALLIVRHHVWHGSAPDTDSADDIEGFYDFGDDVNDPDA